LTNSTSPVTFCRFQLLSLTQQLLGFNSSIQVTTDLYCMQPFDDNPSQFYLLDLTH
jgi:hypothetical protein